MTLWKLVSEMLYMSPRNKAIKIMSKKISYEFVLKFMAKELNIFEAKHRTMFWPVPLMAPNTAPIKSLAKG